MGVTRGALPHVAFTQVRNAWLRDRRVSWKAKGLLGYLASHAEGYRLSQAQIVRESTDGRDAVVTGLRELETAGYLQRNRDRNRAGGRYSEDEYTLVDPFDLAGNLLPVEPRKIQLPYESEPRETRQSGKSDMVTSADFPDRETRPIEEQGEKTTPAPTEQGASNGDGRHLVVVDGEERQLREKLAQTLAAEHYEATGKLGGSKAFLAARGIVLGALEAGHGEQQLRAALAHLRSRGRPVTNSTLGPLLADPRIVTSDGYRPRTNRAYGPLMEIPTDPDAHRGAF